jgi:hypothetical protein
MSNYSEPDNDRYFNDPEYRKKIREIRNGKHNGSRSVLKIVLYGLLSLFLIGLISAGAYTVYLFQGLPSLEMLDNPRTATASVVKSRDGAILDRYFIENRTDIKIDEISPNVINALIATEDHRFYNHWGMDMYRTLAIPKREELTGSEGTIVRLMVSNRRFIRPGRRRFISEEIHPLHLNVIDAVRIPVLHMQEIVVLLTIGSEPGYQGGIHLLRDLIPSFQGVRMEFRPACIEPVR